MRREGGMIRREISHHTTIYRISTPYLTGCSAQRVSLGVHLGISRAAVDGRVRHPFRKPKVDHCASERGDEEGRKGLRRDTRDGSREDREESRRSRE